MNKLKNKPRVSRTNRYGHVDKNYGEKLANFDNNKDTLEVITSSNGNEVTLEKLFGLNKEQVQCLFNKTYDERNKFEIFPNGCQNVEEYKRLLKNNSTVDEINKLDTSDDKRKASTVSLSTSILSSRKPLICPHDLCKKIIAISSFYSHFKYDHPNIPRYPLERGKQLGLPFDVSTLEYNQTKCLGLITLYDRYKKTSSTSLTQAYPKISVDTFWIMMSGSQEEIQTHAYLLIWLFTNTDEYYNCTIEVCAENNAVSYSTFCSVNDIHDSQNISEIAKRLNCLYLTYGSVKNLLQHGLGMQLRISIH